MKQEAIEVLDRRAFTRVVRNVLKEEREGLRSVPLWTRVRQHPELGMEVPMKYFHGWLAELSRDDAIVIDVPGKRYLHPVHGVRRVELATRPARPRLGPGNDPTTLGVAAPPGGMDRSPSRCPNPDCEDSLGGTFEKSQFEKVDEGVWRCRQCGEVQDRG